MLTDDRLIETTGRYREVPEGFWQRGLFDMSFHLINLGDSRSVRERKELDARISTPFDQGDQVCAGPYEKRWCGQDHRDGSAGNGDGFRSRRPRAGN